MKKPVLVCVLCSAYPMQAFWSHQGTDIFASKGLSPACAVTNRSPTTVAILSVADHETDFFPFFMSEVVTGGLKATSREFKICSQLQTEHSCFAKSQSKLLPGLIA